MKTRVSATSLDAFEKLKDSIGEQEKKVFDCICSNKNISAIGVSKLTGIKINAVTGRINRLLHLQLIKVSGKGNKRNVNLYSDRKYYDDFNTFPESWESKYKKQVLINDSLKKKYEAVVSNARKKGIDIEQTVMF